MLAKGSYGRHYNIYLYADCKCSNCGKTFTIEPHLFRVLYFNYKRIIVNLCNKNHRKKMKINNIFTLLRALILKKSKNIDYLDLYPFTFPLKDPKTGKVIINNIEYSLHDQLDKQLYCPDCQSESCEIIQIIEVQTNYGLVGIL